MRTIDNEKVKSKFTSSEVLFEKYVGPMGSSERKEFHEKAMAWYYGDVLRDRRKELKLSQKDLAEKTGTKQSYIARIEKGETDIQLSSLLRIANALGLQINIQHSVQ